MNFFMIFLTHQIFICLRLLFLFFHVNDAQKFLFTKKGRGLEGLPATHDALKLHVKRATYQGVNVWGQATIVKPVQPDHRLGLDFRQRRHDEITMDYPTSCKELVHCGCNKNCGKR